MESLGHRGGEHRVRLSDRLRGVPDGMLRAGRSRRRAPGLPRGLYRFGGRRAVLRRPRPGLLVRPGPGTRSSPWPWAAPIRPGSCSWRRTSRWNGAGGPWAMYLAGHSLGLALALILTGVAIPRGGYVLAFWLLASGPVIGGIVAWLAVRSTANVVTPRAGDQRFAGEVLQNRPAMLVIAGLHVSFLGAAGDVGVDAGVPGGVLRRGGLRADARRRPRRLHDVALPRDRHDRVAAGRRVRRPVRSDAGHPGDGGGQRGAARSCSAG